MPGPRPARAWEAENRPRLIGRSAERASGWPCCRAIGYDNAYSEGGAAAACAVLAAHIGRSPAGSTNRLKMLDEICMTCYG